MSRCLLFYLHNNHLPIPNSARNHFSNITNRIVRNDIVWCKPEKTWRSTKVCPKVVIIIFSPSILEIFSTLRTVCANTFFTFQRERRIFIDFSIKTTKKKTPDRDKLDVHSVSLNYLTFEHLCRLVSCSSC